MADDELRSQVNENRIEIDDLKALVNNLTTEVIRPATEMAVATRQRSEENAILIQNLLDEARADRIENRRRFDQQQQDIRAQQQVIQAMLVEMGVTNSRLDELEAS